MAQCLAGHVVEELDVSVQMVPDFLLVPARVHGLLPGDDRVQLDRHVTDSANGVVARRKRPALLGREAIECPARSVKEGCNSPANAFSFFSPDTVLHTSSQELLGMDLALRDPSSDGICVHVVALALLRLALLSEIHEGHVHGRKFLSHA